MKTKNTLIFEQVSCERTTEYSNSYHMGPKYQATLNVGVEFRCPEHGALVFKVNIICENTNYDDKESIRLAIQNFFNHNYESNTEMYNHHCSYNMEKRGIHNVEYNVGEPYSSLLKSLFENSNWSIQKTIKFVPQ